MPKPRAMLNGPHAFEEVNPNFLSPNVTRWEFRGACSVIYEDDTPRVVYDHTRPDNNEVYFVFCGYYTAISYPIFIITDMEKYFIDEQYMIAHNISIDDLQKIKQVMSNVEL